METDEKVRENRLRRMAARQGFRLLKSRRRDPRAYDFGGYMLVDAHTGVVEAGAHPHAYALNVDQVEQFLTGEPGK